MSEIYHLVYRSEAKSVLNNEAIKEILRKSKNFNEKKSISGILVYRQDKIIQLLEGDKSEVKSLYKKIKADKRHSKVEIILEANSNERIYV